MQLTIEITEEQHHRIKTSAALEGKSISDFALERIMADGKENGEFPEKKNSLEDRDTNSLYERVERLNGRAIPSPMSNLERILK